jgi:hypothetical protein
MFSNAKQMTPFSGHKHDKNLTILVTILIADSGGITSTSTVHIITQVSDCHCGFHPCQFSTQTNNLFSACSSRPGLEEVQHESVHVGIYVSCDQINATHDVMRGCTCAYEQSHHAEVKLIPDLLERTTAEITYRSESH